MGDGMAMLRMPLAQRKVDGIDHAHVLSAAILDGKIPTRTTATLLPLTLECV
jgi:hypothetical protein